MPEAEQQLVGQKRIYKNMKTLLYVVAALTLAVPFAKPASAQEVIVVHHRYHHRYWHHHHHHHYHRY